MLFFFAFMLLRINIEKLWMFWSDDFELLNTLTVGTRPTWPKWPRCPPSWRATEAPPPKRVLHINTPTGTLWWHFCRESFCEINQPAWVICSPTSRRHYLSKAFNLQSVCQGRLDAPNLIYFEQVSVGWRAGGRGWGATPDGDSQRRALALHWSSCKWRKW